MNYNIKLSKLIEKEMNHGSDFYVARPEYQVALGLVLRRFPPRWQSGDDLEKNAVENLVARIAQSTVTKHEYDEVVNILRQYRILPPPLESCTYLTILQHLAVHPEVPDHKVQIIRGLLNLEYESCRYTCMALGELSRALYEQREDEARMEVILTILETEVE